MNVDKNIRLEWIPMDLLVVSPSNIRKSYSEEELEREKTLIKRIGILEPLIVRERGKNYEVIIGDEKLLAVLQLREEGIDLKELPCIVRNLSDLQVMEISFSRPFISGLDMLDRSRALDKYQREEGVQKIIESLGMKPEEQDQVTSWIHHNPPSTDKKEESKVNRKVKEVFSPTPKELRKSG